MEIYQANALKVKYKDRVYVIESQEHCDLFWGDIGAVPGNYICYKYPDLSRIEFTNWETKEKLYLDVLEYSFDYGETWNKMN